MIFLVIFITAVLLLVIGVGAVAFHLRPQLPPAAHESPLLEPPTQHFRKRPQSPKFFKKRVPRVPPVTRDVKPKPGGSGTVEIKKVHVDFTRPCRVTGRVMRACGCQICRELRKKYGV